MKPSFIHPGWPEPSPTVSLLDGRRLRLRPVQFQDYRRWSALRIRDEEILRPVEPTTSHPWPEVHSFSAWIDYFSHLRKKARRGEIVPLVIELDGRFVGQLTLESIQRGSVSTASIGYWVYSGVSDAGVGTAACALGVDHAFFRVNLHRVVATYLPSNPASGRILRNNGFREEGYLVRNLHIDEKWMDHYLMAIVADDYVSSSVRRLINAGRILG